MRKNNAVIRFRQLILGLRTLLAADNAWRLVLERMILRKQNIHLYRMGNLCFLIDHTAGDQNAFRDCFVSQEYSPLKTLLIDSRCAQTPTKGLRVLDCGANVGCFSLYLAHAGFRLETLVAVEMNPAVFSRLHYNLSSNELATTMTVINGAVFPEPRTFKIPLALAGTSQSLLDLPTPNDEGTRLVKSVSLDKIAESYLRAPEPIHVLKVDVEGAEFDVLTRNCDSCLARVEILAVEIHRRPELPPPEQLIQILEEKGFESSISKSDAATVTCFFRRKRQ